MVKKIWWSPVFMAVAAGLALSSAGCASKGSSIDSSTQDMDVSLVGAWVSSELDLTDDSVLFAITPGLFSIDPGDLNAVMLSFSDASSGSVHGKMEFFDSDKRLIGHIGVSASTLTEKEGELELLAYPDPPGGYPVSYSIKGNVLTVSYVGAFRKQQ